MNRYDKWESEDLAWRLEAVGALDRAGGPPVARTDQSVPDHSLNRTPELYVTAGITPMEASRFSTIVPASAMNSTPSRG